MTRDERAERDASIIAAYQAGALMRELAEKHGLTCQGISAILKRHGAQPDPKIWRKRNAEATKANWKDPEFRKRNAEAVKSANSVWPDCPAELREDYERLRHHMSAREARAMFEAERAA